MNKTDSRERNRSPFEIPRRALVAADPRLVCANTGADWEPSGPDEGEFLLPVLNSRIIVSYPDISVKAPPHLDSFALKLLSLIYMSKADGAAPSGKWVPYREIQSARFYEPVVERSVEAPLAEVFGEDRAGFECASESLGGAAVDFGDVSYAFRLFPLVPLCFVLWQKDEEFAARAQVLFDSNAEHHLTAFDLRMGAEELTKLLVKAARSRAES